MRSLELDSNLDKVPFSEKLAYGAGDLASNFIFTTVNTFLLIFYTDVVGLAPVIVSAIFLIARTWDAVNDPIMGIIVDRTRSKWGKFRPYLLFGAVPFGIFGILTFYSPGFLNETGKIIYAGFSYIILGMIYTAVNTPYGALTSAMTQDPQERTSISVVRMFMAIFGALLVSVLMPILVPIIGRGDPSRGYPLTMAIFSSLGIILLLITFSKTKERVFIKPSKEKIGAKQFFRLITKNDQLLILGIVFLVLFTNNTIVSSVGIYFFTYVLGDAALFSIYSLANFLPLLIGIPLMGGVAKKLGKKKTLILGLVISLVAPISIIFFRQHFAILLLARVIASLGASATVAIIWGLVPDTVEYGQWKVGTRAEGAVYSIIGFFFKGGVTLGGVIPGIILGIGGYQANVEQSVQSIQAIIGLYSYVPILIVLLGIYLLRFYKLDETFYNNILLELKEKELAEE